MSDVNIVLLSGNVGSDPETKTSESGKLWATFSLASNSKFKDQEKTEWTPCVAFGKNAETIATHLKKGARIFVTGEKSTSQWTDNQGNKRDQVRVLVHRFHFLTPKSSNANGPKNIPDDDIPF